LLFLLLMKTSSIIYGCMQFGRSWDNQPISIQDRKAAFDAIEAAIESGITAFDLADIYTLGKSETLMGSFIQQNPSFRSKIFIQTKAGIRLHQGILGSNIYDLSGDYLRSQVELSLDRLKTDYLDMFMLHRPDPLVQIQNLRETIESLMESGLIKSFGVSNMSFHQIEWLRSVIPIPIKANQVRFSLGHSLMLDDEVFFNRDRHSDNSSAGTLAHAAVESVELQAWSPLDKGLYLQAPDETDDAAVINTSLQLNKLAKKYDVSPATIQLAWILRLPYKIRPVIGTMKPDRIKEAAQADNVQLDRKDWYDLWISAKGERLP
jgi:predicted oxidoreductase